MPRSCARETAMMVFTDFPYNVSVKTHARGRSRVAFEEFAMASGEMSVRQYQQFLERVMEAIGDPMYRRGDHLPLHRLAARAADAGSRRTRLL